MSSSSGSSFRSSSRSDSENADVEELVQIGTRCRELRLEKEMLRESQSQSVELVRRLEQHMNSLSESRLKDRRRIETLEKELFNCHQEIDYLQDQLNLRNKEVKDLSEHVQGLEEEMRCLREELCQYESKHLMLLEELESKETELQWSAYSVEKLEETISSLTLESQCEIESMKLDVTALEQALSDAKNIQEEKDQLREIVEELRLQSGEAQDNIKQIEKQNKELRERCAASERCVKGICQSIEELLGNENKSPLNAERFSTELSCKLQIPKEAREYLDAIIKKLELSRDVNLKDTIQKYEELVKKLKDEVREEKLKGKEEAEELAQEMAELRYKMTCFLEEECKRRACIEQASLQRIAELEAQIKRERNGSTTSKSMIAVSGV